MQSERLALCPLPAMARVAVIAADTLDWRAAAVARPVLDGRRHAHACPAPGNREVETAARGTRRPWGCGLTVCAGIARAGVRALAHLAADVFKNGTPGP